MRFLTRAWRTGAMPELWEGRVQALYLQHLKDLNPPLPQEAMALALEINLHDGLLRRFDLDREAHTLGMCFRAGDLQVGYFDLDLRYSRVNVDAASERTLRQALGQRSFQLLDHELDGTSTAGWSHRFLFAPEGEAEVTFGSVQWATTPRPDRFGDTAA